MNGIITNKLKETTLHELLTLDNILFTSCHGKSDFTSYNFYKVSYPNKFYVLCSASPTGNVLSDSSTYPMVTALYLITRSIKQIKTIWYEYRKDYTVSQYNPSIYKLTTNQDSGYINCSYTSDSGRYGGTDFWFIGFKAE